MVKYIVWWLSLNSKEYDVTIGNFLACTCFDFVSMMARSLGKQGTWIPCKHIYYIFQHVMFCRDAKEFIHHPTWSENEVHFLLFNAMTIK